MIKRLSIALIALLTFVSLHADDQPSSWSNSIEFSPEFCASSKDAHLFNINYVGLKSIDSNISVGVVAGIMEDWNFNWNPSINAAARGEYKFNYNGVVKPYISADLGVNFLDYAGLIFNPMIGARYKKFNFGFGYKCLVGITDSGNLHFISFRFGYTF